MENDPRAPERGSFMKKRLLAALLALSLTVPTALLSAAGVDYYSYPEVDLWGNSLEDMTPEQQQRARLERIVWYAWLATKYANMPFEDVPTDSWAFEGVNYVWRTSLMSGVSETSFAPDELTNRAMAWTVLARMQGASTAAEEGQAWYEPGVAWASRQGLGDGTNPMGSITREYLAEMLWKCAGGPFIPADLSNFSDRGQVSSYASNAVNWAVAKGILKGADGRLSPQGNVTRAELAAMVMRFKALSY